MTAARQAGSAPTPTAAPAAGGHGIEDTALQVFGRKLPLDIRVVVQAAETPADPVETDKARLKEQALKSESVQAMLDVFAADIRDAEEIQ